MDTPKDNTQPMQKPDPKILSHLIDTGELSEFLQEMQIDPQTADDNQRVRAMSMHQLDPDLGWPRLIRNTQIYESMPSVNLIVEGIPVRLDMNPGRAASIRSSAFEKNGETCFLCELDEGQRGVTILDDRYIVLANPGITIPGDLTISATRHEKQILDGHFGDLLAIARRLYDYSIYYNGAMAGASSPHFHFQGGLKNRLPGERQIQSLPTGKDSGNTSLLSLIDRPDIEVYALHEFSRSAFLARSSDVAEFRRFLEYFYRQLAEVDRDIVNFPNVPDFGRRVNSIEINENEGRMNIMLQFEPGNGEYLAVFFTKLFNRPGCYFREENRILIGMAIKEALGVIITCRDEDFDQLRSHPEWIAEARRDTSLPPAMEKKLETAIRRYPLRNSIQR